MIRLGDPRVTAKLLSHEDYRLQPAMPPKPTNRKMIKLWELRCQELKKPIGCHNAKLRKKIWLEMMSQEMTEE